MLIWMLSFIASEVLSTSTVCRSPSGPAARLRLISHEPLAAEVVAQLQSRNVPLKLEPNEAIKRADGLLMEFLALLVSGRRLESIVRAQAERLSADRTCEREVLRAVCTAHAQGVTVAANVLSELVSKPDELPAALHRLEQEFVLRRIDNQQWGALHELRSRVVKDRLHELVGCQD